MKDGKSGEMKMRWNQCREAEERRRDDELNQENQRKCNEQESAADMRESTPWRRRASLSRFSLLQHLQSFSLKFNIIIIIIISSSSSNANNNIIIINSNNSSK